MIINVMLSIDVDPAEWSKYNNCGPSVSEVRTDIREYIGNAVQQLPSLVDAGAGVMLK